MFNVQDSQDVMFQMENVFVFKDGLVPIVINRLLAHLTNIIMDNNVFAIKDYLEKIVMLDYVKIIVLDVVHVIMEHVYVAVVLLENLVKQLIVEQMENIALFIKNAYVIKDGVEFNVKLRVVLIIAEEMDNVTMEHAYVLMAFQELIAAIKIAQIIAVIQQQENKKVDATIKMEFVIAIIHGLVQIVQLNLVLEIVQIMGLV